MYRQASLCCSWSLGLDLSLEYSSKHYLIFLSCLNWLECLALVLAWVSSFHFRTNWAVLQAAATSSGIYHTTARYRHT